MCNLRRIQNILISLVKLTIGNSYLCWATGDRCWHKWSQKARSDSDGRSSGTPYCWVVASEAPGAALGSSTDWVGCCSEAEGEEGEGVGSCSSRRCSAGGRC